jgi:formate dehydrogenase maturation protein FdhE
MTKKDLIKKILELGKELEKADGFDAIMIVNDMEIEVDNYIKQLPTQNVVQQSEQLVCDSCGCHPNVIYTTSKGRFCERCKPAN